MGLETGSFINDLVITNPSAGDSKSQGDDHLRLIKTALKGSFPTSSKAWYNPSTVTKTTDYSVLATDMNKTLIGNTAGGAITFTMPTLVSGDAGWECFVMKLGTNTNPIFIAPPSGTIQSGSLDLAKTRRCIPGSRTRVLWTGSAWVAERVVSAPVGTVLDFCGSSLPVGFEWPNGQTLGSASANYPDFYLANGGSGVVLDARGRVIAGKDNMGGSTAGRLTSAGVTPGGTTLGAIGGEETHILTEAEMPIHDHAATVNEDDGHEHSFPTFTATFHAAAGAAGDVPFANSTGTTGASETGISVSIGDAGSSEAHLNVQPTIVMNKILVVE